MTRCIMCRVSELKTTPPCTGMQRFDFMLDANVAGGSRLVGASGSHFFVAGRHSFDRQELAVAQDFAACSSGACFAAAVACRRVPVEVGDVGAWAPRANRQCSGHPHRSLHCQQVRGRSGMPSV